MIQVLVLEPKAPTSEPKIAARAVMAPEPEDNIGTALISCSASSEQTSLADIRSKRKAVVVLWHSTCKKQNARRTRKRRSQARGFQYSSWIRIHRSPKKTSQVV